MAVSQSSLLPSGATIDRTPGPEPAYTENKPVLLNPGDFLDANQGALGSALPPASLGEVNNAWNMKQSFGPAPEPVSFIGTIQTGFGSLESGPLAFGRLDSSAPNTPGHLPTIGSFVSQTQPPSEAVGSPAPLGVRSTAPGIGSAFHPYSSPGKRTSDAALSFLGPMSQLPASTSTNVPPVSFSSLPQPVVSALKPSPYLSATGHLELVQPQPPQLTPPRLPDSNSAENIFSTPTATTSFCPVAPTAPETAVASTTATAITSSEGPITTQASASTSGSIQVFSSAPPPAMFPTSVFLKNATSKPVIKAKTPKKKNSNSTGANSAEAPAAKEAGPDERKTATKHPRTTGLSGSSLGPSDFPEDVSTLAKVTH